jgi:adenylylsulfate kinase
MGESHTRSIIKGVTWRLIASATTMTVVYIATGDLALVASVGAIDVVAKIFFYYLHERTWGKVKWGRVGVEPQKCPPMAGQPVEPIVLPTRD